VDKEVESRYTGFAGTAERAAYRTRLGESKGTPEMVSVIKETEATARYVENQALKGAGMYKSKDDIVEFNPKHPSFPQTEDGLLFLRTHEIIHRCDTRIYHSTDNRVFLAAINKAIAQVNDSIYNKRVTAFDKVLEETEKLTREDRKAIHDILSALRLGNNEGLAFGHTVEYWTLDKRHIPSEIFANIGTLDVMARKGLDVIKTYFPELFNAYIEVLK